MFAWQHGFAALSVSEPGRPSSEVFVRGWICGVVEEIGRELRPKVRVRV